MAEQLPKGKFIPPAPPTREASITAANTLLQEKFENLVGIGTHLGKLQKAQLDLANLPSNEEVSLLREKISKQIIELNSRLATAPGDGKIP